MRALAVFALAALGLPGCSPPEAPTELSDLARFTVREFDNEDEDYLVAAANNLALLLDAVDYEASTADRAANPAALTEQDAAGRTFPAGADFEATANVSLFYGSRFPVSAHAAFAAQLDQLGAEPATVVYERTFLEGGDCFAVGDCEVMRTVNQVERENGLFAMRFELLKDFRRTATDDGREAMLSVAWTEQEATAHVGTAVLRQSWTLGVWLEGRSGEGARRLRVNWAETTFTPPLDDDIVRITTRNGMQTALEMSDDAIDG